MAIFYSHIQIISRGKGKSAVATTAYRAGETIKNEYDGIVHDYTRKSGIVFTEILLPGHAPAEYSNRVILWNAVEKVEKASNSRLARELDIALPVELTREQNISLIRDYVKRTFVEKGMCADLCVHDTGKGNPHAHIMLTVRPIEPDGKWGDKQKKEYIFDNDGNKIYDPKKRQYKCRSIPSTDWDNRENTDIWRATWEDMANVALKLYGFDSRIDRRSYEEQGIEQIPTVHMGVAAMQMERRDISTERGNMNRDIEVGNKEIRKLRARITKLDKWIEEVSANPAPPTISEIITERLSWQGESGLYRLKAAAGIFNFLMNNEIYIMADLENKVVEMGGKVQSIRTDLKKVERRIGTLRKHIEHGENFKKYRKVKAKYEDLYSQYKATQKETGFGAKRKTQKAHEAANDYYESHRAELAVFDNADKYLRDVLQGWFDPKKMSQLSKWREELAVMTVGKDALYQDYHALKDETKKVEEIKRSVSEIWYNESAERIPRESQDGTQKKSREMAS